MTGVLPVAFNDATKVLQALLEGGKEYVGVMRLHGDVSEARLREVFREFTGEIYQRPPLRSSVKRQVRSRTIYYNELGEVKGRSVLFRVGCQSGTYIRKIVHDMGEALGCGAHMAELRRTRVGPFAEDERLVTLQDIAGASETLKEGGPESALRRVVRPVEEALSPLHRVYVKDSAVDALCHGADLAVPGVCKLTRGLRTGDLVAVLSLKGELVALGRARMPQEAILESERGVAVKTERVVMRPGTYPKGW